MMFFWVLAPCILHRCQHTLLNFIPVSIFTTEMETKCFSETLTLSTSQYSAEDQIIIIIIIIIILTQMT